MQRVSVPLLCCVVTAAIPDMLARVLRSLQTCYCAVVYGGQVYIRIQAHTNATCSPRAGPKEKAKADAAAKHRMQKMFAAAARESHR